MYARQTSRDFRLTDLLRLEPNFRPERLMFPFTVSCAGGPNGRTYTLCTA